jgi:hypothetical protein
MPAVETQLLADETNLAQLGPLASALGTLTSEVKLANLRRASGEVLAAYAKRFQRTAGSSFELATWGDFTIGIVVDIAQFRMLIGPRGLNPSSPDGKLLVENYQRAQDILNAIADLENKNARIDPDAVGSPDADDFGPLACSEGGALNEADGWTKTGTSITARGLLY